MVQLSGENIDRARNKLQGIIDRGRIQAVEAIERIKAEAPNDMVVPTSSITYKYRDGHLEMAVPNGGEAFPLHDFALGQISDKAGLPRKFLEALHEEGTWGQELIAHNLNEVYGHRTSSKHLVRTVNGQVRGFLSDRYLRLDTPLIVEAFSAAAAQYGLVPVEAIAFDTKFSLKAALTQVVEPVPGEPIVLGVSLRNSDFGDGAFELRMFAMRVMCTNMAVCEDGLRRVHLGSRLSGNVAISRKTFELDNKALASATSDVVAGMFEPEKVQARLEAVRTAATQSIDIKKALDAARKSGDLSVTDTKSVTDIYNTGGIELLPPGDNAWRLSNAISFFAQQVEPARKLDLEVLAGKVAGLHLD